MTGESGVKDAVTSFLLEELGGPFKAPRNNPGCPKADQAAVSAWLGALGPVAERVCSDKRPGPCELERHSGVWPSKESRVGPYMCYLSITPRLWLYAVSVALPPHDQRPTAS